MLTVACVLKSGGDFDESYVERLWQEVRLHLPQPHRFACLTDLNLSLPILLIPLRYALPGWWSKMEVFAGPGPALYLDLDTVIIGDITPLAEAVLQLDHPWEFLMLRRWRRPGWGSGIMGWKGDWSWILNDFMNAKKQFVQSGRGWTLRERGRYDPIETIHYQGDQDWIENRMDERGTLERIAVQDVCPGIYSYKHHICGQQMPEDARIIVFHGKPRPSEITL